MTRSEALLAMGEASQTMVEIHREEVRLERKRLEARAAYRRAVRDYLRITESEEKSCSSTETPPSS